VHIRFLRTYLITIFSLWPFFMATAQSYKSEKGRFEVEFNKGCVPFIVKITNLLPPPEDGSDRAINYIYEGDLESGREYEKTTHEYNASHLNGQDIQTITIFQIISSQANLPGGNIDQINIQIYRPKQPEFFLQKCQNNSVVVAINYEEDNYEQYFIDYHDGSTELVSKGENVQPHSFASTGEVSVTVKGLFLGTGNPEDEANNACNDQTKSINLSSPIIPPTITNAQVIRQESSNGAISITHNLGIDNVYSLEMAVNNNTDFYPIRFLEGPSPISIVEGLDTENNIYCFRINLRDECLDLNNYTPSVCSVILLISSEENQNRVNWRTIGQSTLRIQRNPQSPTDLIFTTNTGSYTDRNVFCNSVYCYTLTASNSTQQSTSAEICSEKVVSTLAPPALNNITATIVGNEIQLSWPQPENVERRNFNLRRSESSAPFTPIGNTSQQNYLDRNLRVQRHTYFYKLTYIDDCNNESFDTEIRPVFLRRTVNDDSDFLIWNTYQGWMDGVDHYILEKADRNNRVFEEIRLSNGTTSYFINDIPEPEQLIIYRIKAVKSGNTAAEAYSNELVVELPVQAHFPKAFTPNNDRKNDEFKLAGGGRYVSKLKLTILNRWGEMVFYTEEIDEGWNGSLKGKYVPEGTYIYHAEITDQLGRKEIKKGTVMVLKPGK
jgi:gliding motility-associated-like protein